MLLLALARGCSDADRGGAGLWRRAVLGLVQGMNIDPPMER